MAYRQVYFRIRTDCYSSGWTSDADRIAFEKESRRLFQELGWAVTFGHNGSCDTAAKDQQDLYLHPSSFSGVIDEASIQPLQEQLSNARTFRCYHVDRYEESFMEESLNAIPPEKVRMQNTSHRLGAARMAAAFVLSLI